MTPLIKGLYANRCDTRMSHAIGIGAKKQGQNGCEPKLTAKLEKSRHDNDLVMAGGGILCHSLLYQGAKLKYFLCHPKL